MDKYNDFDVKVAKNMNECLDMMLDSTKKVAVCYQCGHVIIAEAQRHGGKLCCLYCFKKINPQYDNAHHKAEILAQIAQLETGEVSLDDMDGILQIIKCHVSHIKD